jgi:hypothetical protein
MNMEVGTDMFYVVKLFLAFRFTYASKTRINLTQRYLKAVPVPVLRIPDSDPACHFDADPDSDPACHFDPDSDPTFQFDADPDPCFQIKSQNLRQVFKYEPYSIHFGLSFASGCECGSSLSL